MHKLGDKPAGVPVISTGSLTLDCALGGGLAKGRIIELYGPESSGKTSVALTAISNVQKEGGTAMFVDAEFALDARYARRLGVVTKDLAVAQPETAEMTLDLVNKVANSGQAGIIVIDSVAALVPQAELEGAASDITVGALARLMSRELRKLVAAAANTETTVVFLNQTRDKIGGFSRFGTPKVTTGGNALNFFASQRISVRKGEPQKYTSGENKGKTYGFKVKYKVEKNKIAAPFREAESIISYNRGINLAAEVFTVSKEYGIISGNGGFYKISDADYSLPRGEDAVIREIEKSPELFSLLDTRVREAMERSFEDDLYSDEDGPEDADQMEGEISPEE